MVRENACTSLALARVFSQYTETMVFYILSLTFGFLCPILPGIAPFILMSGLDTLPGNHQSYLSSSVCVCYLPIEPEQYYLHVPILTAFEQLPPCIHIPTAPN